MFHFEKDKYIHCGVCFVITFVVLVLFYLLKAHYITATLAGVLTTMGAALGKEYGDKVNPNNKWDWYDIYADIAGTIAGLFIGSFLWM